METLNGGAQSSPQGPTQCGAKDEVTRRAKDGRKPGDGQRMPGAGLSWTVVLGRPRPKGQPSSRTGENSPYGMIGGIEETSASFEARSAPRSYPTARRRTARVGAVADSLDEAKAAFRAAGERRGRGHWWRGITLNRAYETQDSRLRMYQIPATPSAKAVICAKVRPVARIL